MSRVNKSWRHVGGFSLNALTSNSGLRNGVLIGFVRRTRNGAIRTDQRHVGKRTCSLKVPKLFACLLALQLTAGQLCLPTLAQDAPPNPPATNLDLGSADKTVAAASVLQPSAQATITLGTNTVTYTATDMLTAAEMVAVRQVMATGTQYLQLNAQGIAVGGGIHLQHYASGLNNLVIPEGVRASQNAAVLSSLNLTGNLTNSGTLNIFSSNPAVTAATINANNIYNNVGALINSSLATLNLNAVNNIVNNGTIMSAGNLNMTAGGSIVNTAVMQAMSAMNLATGAGNIVNSGLISSLTGNISVSTQTINNLLVNNTGGIMQALNGNINVRDVLYSAKSNTSLMGGDWLSQALNTHSGNGIVDINVDKLTGKVGVYAGEVHIQAATDNLLLGDMVIIGDPTYYNTLGDVTIGGSLIFSGQALAIIANQNIVTTSGAGAIDTSSTTSNGGRILMWAGVNFTSTGPTSANNDTTSTLTVTGVSSTGGKIDLATGTPITSLTSRGSTVSGNGNGGSIQLAAFSGTNSDSGTINLPSAVTITTGGGGSGSNAPVRMLAEATTGTAINIGGIDTTGGSGTATTGSISLYTDATNAGMFPASITNGVGGSIGTVSDLGTSASGIVTGPLTTMTTGSSSAGIAIISGGNVFINGNVILNSVASATVATGLSLKMVSSSAFSIGAGASGTGINGSITATAGAAAPGADISITNSGTGGITLSNPANISKAATSGAGGILTLAAYQGPLSIGTGTLSTSAAVSGTAGAITLTGTTITVTGAGPLLLSADSVGTGNGGLVTITASAADSSLNFANTTGGIVISATGGATSGGGGTVNVSSGGNISYNAAITIAPNATNGAGGNISLKAGTAGPGSLTISNGLSTNANGTGAAGIMTLQANSQTALTIGNNLTASGGTGGTIRIANTGIGGIDFTITNAITATATGSSGAGGTITVDAGTLGAISAVSGTWSASASTTGGASGAGGTITINGAALTVTGGALTLSADGAQSLSTSRGGTVSITTFASTSDITVGSGSGNVIISAVSGIASLAQGGVVSITTGRNLTVNPNSLTVVNSGTEITGGILTLTAGAASTGNLFVNGSLDVSPFSCSCGSNGGTITLNSNSTTAFTVGAGATTNGVNGTLTSNAGNIGSTAGTINITNHGTGGITISDPANILIGSNGAGAGGSLKLEAPAGFITFTVGGTLSVNSGTASTPNGGNLVLYGTGLFVSSGNLLLSANGGSTGNGGTITITSTGFIPDLFIGSAANQFSVSATGGSTSGNGGTVTINSGRFLQVDANALTAEPGVGGSGNGPTITLTAGSSSPGSLLINGNLQARGRGTGNGGNVTLNLNSNTAFSIVASGALAAGINGTITATSLSTGIGGSVTIRNFGTGGITLDSSSSINVAPTNGAGGSIELNAGTGPLSFTGTSNTLNANAVGSGAAGSITLKSGSFSLSANTILQASGIGSGNAGTVTLLSTGSATGITVGSTASAFSITAQSGASGGDGGIVSITSGLDLTIDTANLNVNPQGTNGNGAQISLIGGANGSGNVFLNNSLSANGNGTGNGGSIVISSNSSTAFTLSNGATTNGVGGGALTALDGSTGSGTAQGGTISITNRGTGGITFTATGSVAVNQVVGSAKGGTITLNAGPGILTIPGGTTISANATGTSSNAFNGGTITLTASSLSVSGGTLTLEANANSAGTSPGGTISVTTTSSAYDIVVGSGTGELVLQAIASNCSGCSGVARGGSVSLTSASDITIAPASLNINTTQSGSGEGGTLSLTAGTSGMGNVFISSSLSVDGHNAGGGGTITIVTNSALPFTIGSGATTNGINGVLSAQSGASGGNFWGGGTISITNNGNGGIALVSTSSITVSGNGSNAYGGNLTLNAGQGIFTTPTGTLSVNAIGNSFGNPGGTISITGSHLNVTGGALTLTANAGSNGFGGTITLTQTSNTLDLAVGTGTGQFILSATGSGSSGQGGTISLSSGRHLTIAPGSVTADPGTSGKGATYSFTAGATGTTGNLYISGSLSANGAGSLGQGGSITLVARSSSVFNVAAGATTNGVSGTLSANNSSSSMIGGTISITNNGTGGITLGALANLSVNASGVTAAGGNIMLNAGNGILTLPSGTLSVSAIGSSTNNNGGTLNLSASQLSLSGGNLLLTANGQKAGNGGTISVTTTGDSYDLVVGSGSGQLSLSATGGRIGQLGSGSGGSISLSSGRHLTVDPNYLIAQSYSFGASGPTYNLTAGTTATTGNVFVNGNLSASSGSFILGNGGSINITTKSNTAFTINPGATINGINGTLTAFAGLIGNGGTISVTNSGTGGITLTSLANISASGGTLTGSGGSLTLNAGTGALTIASGTLSVSSNSGNAGSITLIGTPITITGASALTLLANASGTGSGGTILISSLGSADVTIGVNSGELFLSAHGGSAFAASGNAGSITVSAGQNLTVSTSAVLSQALGLAGTGGTYSLSAGASGSGNLFVNGSLYAVGKGTGNGGSISLSSNSTTLFNIQSGAITNGVNGVLITEAGTTSGNGGTISVTNNGTGGITVSSAASIAVGASMGSAGGAGGTLSLIAPTGPLTIPSVTYIVSATGTGNYNGGTFTITGSPLSLSTVTAMANARGIGNGGTISIISYGSTADITSVGVSALGGSPNSASGNGGSISVSAGRNLTIDFRTINIAAQGINGNGATVNFTAGLTTTGDLRVAFATSANGKGIGNGGTISLNSNSSTPFNIGSSATNGVLSGINANSGSFGGNAGSITVTNNGSGGIILGAIGNISVTPHGTGGAGGTINLNGLAASPGTLTIPTGTISVSAAGTGDYNGGTLILKGSSLSITGGALTLYANGVNSGNGGTVTVTSTLSTASGALTIGSATGNLVTNATSGGVGGGGGTINITAGQNLTVNTGSLSVATTGPNGNGGSISLTTDNGLMLISGTLSANGVGTGNGGSITLNVQNNASTQFIIGGASTNGVTGSLTANAGSNYGNGGSVIVNDYQSWGTTLSSTANISAAASAGGGNGGTIKIIAIGTSDLELPGGTLSVNGQANGNGGTIEFNTFYFAGQPNLTLNANGSGYGNGGLVSLTETQAGGRFITVGTNEFEINANSGTSGGNGGTVYLNAAGGDLTVDMAFLNAGPLGANGNGANLTFINGSTGWGGSLEVTGTINANGVGNGNGGSVTINYTDSSNPLIVGSATSTQFVSGNITADASGTGNGGSVSITNNETAAVNVTLTGNITANSTNGMLGTLTFNKAGQAISVTGGGQLGGSVVSSGTAVTLSPLSGLTAQTITATAGSILLSVNSGALALASTAALSATQGSITIQNNDTAAGTIAIGANSTISATSTTAGQGRINIVIGVVPGSPVAGTAPSNFSANLTNGGTIFYGSPNFTSNAPTNTANVDGARVVFNNTGSIGASAITLDGGVVINSTGPGIALLTSLDLTDPTVTAYIQTQQGLGTLGGTLILSSGVAQPGSTLTIQPGNLSASLSSFNIPTGVVVTMDSFTGSNTITIDITGSSFTTQATLTGTAAFGSGSGTLVINSTQSGNAFLVNSAGLLSSSAILDISTNRSTSIAGTITASTLNITTTANNGAISVTGSITGSTGVNLTTNGTGAVTSGVSSFILATNSPITISANDVAFSGSVNAGTGTVTLKPNGAQTMSLNGAGGTFSVLSTDLNNIIAGAMVLGSNTSSGTITLAGALTLPGSGTPGTTAGLYNLELRSGAAGGTYSAGSNALNIRGQNLTISVAGSANTGSGGISGTSGTVAITGGGVTIGSAINLSGNGIINLTSTGNTTLAINGNTQTASGGQVLFTTDTGSVSQGAGSITTGSLAFSSTSGSASLTTTVSSLTANTTGSVNITNTGALTIGPSGATNTANSFTVSNNQTITIDGSITATSISGVTLTTSANNGNITANADVTGGGVTLTTNGSGIVTNAVGTEIEATVSTLSITARNIQFDGTLTGAGDVMLLVNGSVPVAIGGSSGTFNVTTSVLNAVTANNLLVGYGSSMTVVGPVDISSNTFNALILQPSGDYSAAGQTITIGSKQFRAEILTSGTINTGTVTGTTGSDIYFHSQLGQTVSGVVTGDTLRFQNDTSGNISFAANVIGGSSVTISANTAGEITQSSGTISATGNLSMYSNSGIGLLSPIQTAVSSLTINTGSSVSAFIINAGALQVGGSTVGNQLQITTTGAGGNITTSGNITATNGQLQLSANGNITISNAISGDTVVLQALTATGAISLNHNVTGTNGVTISTSGSGNVSNSATRSISATNAVISITANDVTFSGTINAGTSGAVLLMPNGTKSIAVGGGVSTFSVSAAELAAITSGTLTIGTTAQAGGFTVAGNLNVSGAGPAGAYNLVFNNGGNYTASGRTITLGAKTLTVNALGTVTTGTVTGGNTTVQMSGGTGLTVSNSVTVTGGTVNLSTTNNGSISIDANVGGGAITSVSADGVGTITRSGNFTLTGTNVDLTADSGDIGSLGSRIQTAASTLTVNSNTAGNFIENAGAVAIGTSTVNGVLDISTTGASADITTSGNISTPNGSLYLTANGNITTSNTISGSAMVFQTSSGSNGSIVINSNVTGIASVDFTTDGNGNVTSSGGTLISSGNGALSGNITITANDVTFSGSLSSLNGGSVTLRPNGAKSISVGGAGGIFSVLGSDLSAITADTLIVGTTAQTGGFTVAGNLNVSGAGPNGVYNLQFNNGGNYTAAGRTITLGSKTLTVTALGTLNGGTITSTSGDVSLSGGSSVTAADITTANNGSGVSGNVNVSSSGTVVLQDVFTGSTSTATAGSITITAVGAITTDTLNTNTNLNGVGNPNASGSAGGAITLDSGSATFDLNSINTASGGSTAGALIFKQNTVVLSTPTVTFATNSNITMTSNSSSTGPSLSINLGNSNTLGSINTSNNGSGVSGNVALSSSSSITLTDIHTGSTGTAQAGTISINSSDAVNVRDLYASTALNAVGNANTIGGAGNNILVTASTSLTARHIYTNVAGSNASGTVTLSSGGTIVTTNVFSGSTGSGVAGSITITATDSITTGTLNSNTNLNGVGNPNASGSTGGAITLDSGNATFNLGSVNTASGGSLAGDLVFKQNTVVLPTPTVTFTAGATITMSSNSSSNGPSLSINLGNANSLGAITTANVGSGAAGSLTLTSASAITTGSITATSGSSSGGNIVLTSTTSTVATGAITTTNAPITITASDISFGSAVNAGTGTVTLLPNSALSISVGGAGGSFSVLGSDLANITAGTLIVGTTSQAGDFTVASNINVAGTGAGKYSLEFNTGGNYTAVGQTITLGTHTFAVNALGTLNTGTVTGGNTTVQLTGGTGMTVSGSVSATAGTIDLATTDNGSITLSANVSTDSLSTMNLTADGSGSITRTGNFTLTAGTIALASSLGDIGQLGSEIQTSANTLSVNTGGSAYIAESNSVSLGASVVSGTFNLTAATNGSIAVTGDSFVGTLDLTVSGSGQITRTGNSTLTANVLKLNSTTGDIGSDTTRIQVAGVSNLETTTTTGSAYITLMDSNISLGATSIGGTFALNTVIAANVSNSTDINAGTINIDLATTGSLNATGGILIADNISVTSGSGNIIAFVNTDQLSASTSTLASQINITSYGTSPLTLNGLSAGNLIQVETVAGSNGSLIIAGNISSQVEVDLTTDGSGTMTRSGNFTITAPIVALQVNGNGDIGQSSTPILTNSAAVTASTGGSIYLTNTTDLATSSFTIGANKTLDISTSGNGSIAVDSDVTGDTIRLATSGTGDITRVGNVTLTANTINLQTASGNIGDLGTELQVNVNDLTVASGGSVLINETDSVNLGASTISGTFILNTTGNDGSITITGNVSATSMLLSTDGTGEIQRSGNFTLSATAVINLGSDNGNIGTALAPLQIDTNSLTIQTGGSVLLSEANSINLGFTSVGGTFELTTGNNGDIVLSSTISATSMTLSANGGGSITDGGSGSLSATSVINLVSGSGDIGSSGSPISTDTNTLTANTTGSIYISEADSINLGFTNAGGVLELTTSANGSITVSGQVSAANMTLTADGLGDIIRSGSNVLTAGQMTLNSTLGNLGSPSTPLLTDAGILTLNTGGHSYVTNSNSLTLANSNIGGELSLTTNGTLTTSTVNNAETFTLTAASINNSATQTATGPTGSITITGAGSSSVTINGGGTLVGAGGITINATNNDVIFAGNQNFNGDAIIDAVGTNGDVIAANGVSVFSTGNLTINSGTTVVNEGAFGAAGTLVVNQGPPVPPTPPTPSPTEESTPTLIAIVADASSATDSSQFQTRNDPIVISTDQNQGIAGNSLSQALLTNVTNGLSTILFGGSGSTTAPSGTISNSNVISNAPNAGPIAGDSINNSANNNNVVTSEIDLTPFADLLPSGDRNVTGQIVDSTTGNAQTANVPTELSAQPGTIVPARSPSDNQNGQSNPLSSLGEMFKVGETRTNLVMFTMANQVFSGFIGGNNDTMVSGTPGTIFSTDKNTVVLHTGHMLTDNGKQGMTVFTNQAAVMIGADAAAVVDVHPGAPTRVMAVAGQGSSSTTVRTRDGLVIPLAAGQEVIIGQTDLSDEDLIPVDGMDREFVSGGIQVSSRKVAKDNFSLDEFMDKEIMVAGVPVRLGGNNKRLHGKISAAAKRQSHNSRIVDNYHKKKKHGSDENDEDKSVPVITKGPNNQIVVEGSTEPARVLAEKETEFSLTQPGRMKLIKGSLFMRNSDATIVDTPLGRVLGVKDSMFKVTSDQGTTRVQAMSGPDDVTIVAGKRLIPLNCGKEVFVTDHKPTQSELVPADGVGRRGMSAFALDGTLSAIVGDFSMVTLLNSHQFLSPLKNPVSQSDQQLHAQIVKAAAVIQQVLGNRGRYYIAPKEHASVPLPDWVMKTTSENPAKMPLLKALLDNSDTRN